MKDERGGDRELREWMTDVGEMMVVGKGRKRKENYTKRIVVVMRDDRSQKWLI